MRIVNQDKDLIIVLEDKEDIYIENKYYKGILFGTNIMIKSIAGPILLGTFDIKSDAQQIVDEIKTLYGRGFENYSIPEDTLDLSDLFQEG